MISKNILRYLPLFFAFFLFSTTVHATNNSNSNLANAQALANAHDLAHTPSRTLVRALAQALAHAQAHAHALAYTPCKYLNQNLVHVHVRALILAVAETKILAVALHQDQNLVKVLKTLAQIHSMALEYEYKPVSAKIRPKAQAMVNALALAQDQNLAFESRRLNLL